MIIVVMGVCGCGKTTVGKNLANLLGAEFIEGDDFHPVLNTVKMTSGIALTDDDRWPWLDGITARAADLLNTSNEIVICCSALKRSYRDRLRGLDTQMKFVHLTGNRSLLQKRLAERQYHFMPPGLLDSQLAALEPPGEDEGPLIFDIADEPDELAKAIIHELFAERT
jgi:gluconokinase